MQRPVLLSQSPVFASYSADKGSERAFRFGTVSLLLLPMLLFQEAVFARFLYGKDPPRIFQLPGLFGSVLFFREFAESPSIFLPQSIPVKFWGWPEHWWNWAAAQLVSVHSRNSHWILYSPVGDHRQDIFQNRWLFRIDDNQWLPGPVNWWFCQSP